MNPDTAPYELYTGQVGGFVAVEHKEEVLVLPLFSLSRMVLRGQDVSQQLVCEFAAVQVVAHGHGLRDVLDQMMLGRVRLLRIGMSSTCSIRLLHTAETA
jgi:hypothetical protein